MIDEIEENEWCFVLSFKYTLRECFAYLSARHKLISNSLPVDFPSQQNQQRISEEYNTELSQKFNLQTKMF